ncbi:lipopolysaccharide transport periplasmic protein LptA [Pinirhizobacter sp.]|jgi:lipopolysaccharide export system protein LptA|uniref:lipopolysaccharide transport periplasmic protein LptA n=1 Tax=Pinirhizobacter sp. TaxID=2950432 RepID=UPI002F3FB1D0
MLTAFGASARQSDRNEPINAQGVSVDATQGTNGLVVYKGKVVMTQGTLKVTGDIAHIYLDADNQVLRAVVDGKPATFHEIDDNCNNVDGHALNIDYVVEQNVVTLTTNAWVKQQGRGESNGDKLVYHTDTSNMTGQSGDTNLVTMQFLPKPKAAAPGQPAPPRPQSVPNCTPTPKAAPKAPAAGKLAVAPTAKPATVPAAAATAAKP